MIGGGLLVVWGLFWGGIGVLMAATMDSSQDTRAGLMCALVGGLLPLLIGATLLFVGWQDRLALRRFRDLMAFVRTLDGGPILRDDVAGALELAPLETERLLVDAAALGILTDDDELPYAATHAPHAAPPTRQSPPVGGTLPVGAVLGGTWRISGFLGAGGMGHVYDVVHVRTGRHYALKTLLPSARLSEEALRRFEREARAASALGHPSIVAVHDFDRVDGLAYLVMDRLEGETLEDRLKRRGSLPWAEAEPIVLALADALGAAHDAGLLHRDLKPGNVFLARQGESERAMLLDFGLAKPIDDAASSRITATGMAVGTPLYMSPEQARGEALDVRTDVYGLCAVIYEVVTGAPPFLEPTPARAYARLLSEPALPASQLAPQPIPGALDALLARGLAKDPAERPRDVRDLRAALTDVARVAS